MLIQIILVAAVFASLVFFMRNSSATRLRASKKLLLVVFIIFATITILWPQTMTDIAHLVGVGRGADLLLYGLVIGFVFVVLSVYLKFKDMEYRYTKLARHIALVEADQEKTKRAKA
jgi:hypothetical protein